YISIPSYIRYIKGSDRITDEFPNNFDLTIIVDTVSGTLLEHTLSGNRLSAIEKKPVLLLDCHPVENSLPLAHAEFFKAEGDTIATSELVVQLAAEQNWEINQTAATHVVEAILADTLGMATEAVTSQTLRTVANMLDKGAKMSEID